MRTLVDAGVLVGAHVFDAGCRWSTCPASPRLVSSSHAHESRCARHPHRVHRRRHGLGDHGDPGVLGDSRVPCRFPPRVSRRLIRRRTAWRCMFEPINARLASSCSRNGTIDAATETICLGGDVNVIYLFGWIPYIRELALVPDTEQTRRQTAVLSHRAPYWPDAMTNSPFLDRRQVMNLVRDLTVQ